MKIILTIIAAVTLALAGGEYNAEQLLINGNNQFTSLMFNEVVKENVGKSVVLSAFSVLTPLGQLTLATEGVSHDELLKAIGMPNDNVTKIAFSEMNKKVRTLKGVDLKMASRIYITKNAKLNEDFQTVSRDVFGSDVKNVDFEKNVESAAIINQWVEDQTNKRIKDLVNSDSLDANTRAVLVNAIYFKGKWKHQFTKSNTRDLDFHITKSNVVKVPTMYRSAEYLYGESSELNAKLLRMPYEGDETSMLIILPNEIEGIADLEEKLKNPLAIAKATESMSKQNVDVYLPKFKIETTTDLKKLLKNIGVKSIFEPSKAKLTRLLKEEDNLFVSEAIQKAFIEVNEEGAEAAAANAFHMAKLAPMVQFQHTFRADHPFVFQLCNGEVTLFTGVYRR